MSTGFKPSFSLSERRAICLAGDKLFVYHYAGGSLADSFVFEATEVGVQTFQRYLEETPATPIYMLVDVVEEEYRQETIPHVAGRDRKTVLSRKQARLFRGTPYVNAVTQGRETEGRKDDRVLLTALMNPEAIRPWVDAVNEAKVPLAGIYSLPTLSARLFKKLQIEGENVLLVSLQSGSGLRQSFFRDGELKVSRLAKMPRLGTVPFADYMLGELEKLRRYLNSLRLMSRDHPLDIHVFSYGEPLDNLIADCSDNEFARYHLHDLSEIEKKLGVKVDKTTPYADRLFAHLLLSTTPPNQYAETEETRYFSLHKSRIAMMVASVVLLLGGAAFSGFNFIQGVALKQEGLAAQEKANYYQARYDIARENLPPTAVEPMDIQTAVEAVEQLVEYRASPLPLMKVIGETMLGFPEIELDDLNWSHSDNPRFNIMTEDSADEIDIRPDTDVPEYPYYHIARVDGHIGAFKGDYRNALAQVRDFAQSLQTQAAVYDVMILRQPLDLSSEGRLEGSAEESANEAASFTIRLVMGVGDGES